MTKEPIAEVMPTQAFFRVAGARREKTLEALLEHHHRGATLVLCNMKQQCEIVARNLRAGGWSARALHGNLEQRDREQVLVQFVNGSCNVLVATDVAAEALGETALGLVVSFDLPRNPAIHAVRAGFVSDKGLMASLVAPDERQRFERLAEQYPGVSEPENLPFPDEMHPQVRREAPMVTLMLDGGEKDHISSRAVVDALTKQGGLEADEVGRIDVRDFCVYLAVSREHAREGLQSLRTARLHGKTFGVRSLSLYQ
ncbi:DbpA-like RNA binding protein [Halospina denitrificans]|uniref:DbpA-like RNA binding protein n=1 Tax=Halospina denitrificans TaxID=332522 RepID=A0A4R7JYS8_9GAMM|nr:helicase-related protein [Halospina denitrificans]TDT43375.1 DbpA-like RNA binding protein [Halospina denitrificans]